jgi:hypothetical protein
MFTKSLYLVIPLAAALMSGSQDKQSTSAQAPSARSTSTQAPSKKSSKTTHKTAKVSFKHDVYPILKMNCMPCHTEDEMNPSELYMETYEGIMKGGKHGAPIIAGKADSSLIIKKLIPPPPFGDPMPMKRKTQLAADTVNIIKKWINEGAKNN